MSYTTPVETTTSFKDLEVKLQGYSSAIKGKLSWLTYAFGLADRTTKFDDKKSFVFPAIYQDTNAKDPLSLMPSDLHQAYCFWTADSDQVFDEYNWSRIRYNVALIFYMDLRDIAPTDNWKLARTKLRQDILKAIRETHYSGLGVLNPVSMVEDDIVKVFEGFSIDEIDNIYKTYPKWAMRINFEFGLLRECSSSYNTYA